MGKYLYEEIKEYLLKLIKANKEIPQYQLPSENQLALKFSTTRITAKRALTELQEEGYIYRVHGKGSFISPEASKNKELESTSFICMLLPNIESRFIARLVDGVKAHLEKHSYHLIILSESEAELTGHNLIRKIVDFGIKGIIVFPNSRARYNKDLLLLAFNKFPVVFVDRTLHDFDISAVTSDHIQMGRQGVQLLLDRGCKNIGFITRPPEYSSSIARRITGYERAHVENGMRILPKNIFYITKNDLNQVDSIYSFLTSNTTLDGLLSYGGQAGYNVYRAIKKAGIRVPEKMKVIFFDDEYSDFSDLLPFAPSCISQRGEELGRCSAELILNYIAKKTVANDKILLECDFIERESTKTAQK